MSGRRLGTVREAADALGTDSAGVWERVSDGILRADRPGEGPWVIYVADKADGEES